MWTVPGIAHWKTVVDSGSAPFGGRRYNTYGGPWLAADMDVEAFVAAGDKGIDLLPSGHGSITIGRSVQIDGPHGPKTVKLAFLRGLALHLRLFGSTATIISLAMPE